MDNQPLVEISHVSRDEVLTALGVRPSTLRMYQSILNDMAVKKQISSDIWDYQKNDKGYSIRALKFLLWFRSLIVKTSIKTAIKEIRRTKLNGI
jgi:hypothetical protein